MKIIPIVTALASAGGTYAAVKDKNIPGAVKTVATIGAGGAGYFVGNKLQTLLIPGSAEQVVGGAKTEMQQLLKKNLTLPPDQQQLATVTPAQMKIYANNLFTAMDGAGTDWEAIKAVIDAMNSDVDILNLIQAFGTKAGTSWFASSTPDDLATWFAGDGVTAYVNKILDTKAKITYRF